MAFEAQDTEKYFPERFDFTMHKYMYKKNMKVDQYGERVTSYSNEPSRIVSCDCMIHEISYEIDDAEDFEYVDQYGNVVPQPRPAKMIPVNEIVNAFYFQWRIDKISNEMQINPKIIIGICRDGFG